MGWLYQAVNEKPASPFFRGKCDLGKQKTLFEDEIPSYAGTKLKPYQNFHLWVPKRKNTKKFFKRIVVTHTQPKVK